MDLHSNFFNNQETTNNGLWMGVHAYFRLKESMNMHDVQIRNASV